MTGQARNFYNSPLWCLPFLWELPNTNRLTRNLTIGQDKILGTKLSLVCFPTWGRLYNSYPTLHFLLPYKIIIIIIIVIICSQRKHEIKDAKESKKVVKERTRVMLCLWIYEEKKKIIATNHLLFQITNTHWRCVNLNYTM